MFGEIVVGATRGSPVQMKLNAVGNIIQSIWQSLTKHHQIVLDQFQIMPNHIHFVLGLTDGSRHITGGSHPASTLGLVVGFFKSESTKQIRQLVSHPQYPVWQRNYYDHVIRTENDLEKIREYIRLNPSMWERDRNNPKIINLNRTNSL